MKLPEFKSTTSASMQSAMMTPQLRPMTIANRAPQHNVMAGQLSRQDAERNALAKYGVGLAIADAATGYLEIRQEIDLADQTIEQEKSAAFYQQHMGRFQADEILRGGEIDPATDKQRHFGSEERYRTESERVLSEINDRGGFTNSKLVHKFGMKVSASDYTYGNAMRSSGDKHRIAKASGEAITTRNSLPDSASKIDFTKDMIRLRLTTPVQGAKDIENYRVEGVVESFQQSINSDPTGAKSADYLNRLNDPALITDIGITNVNRLHRQIIENKANKLADSYFRKADNYGSKDTLDRSMADLMNSSYQDLGMTNEREKQELLGIVRTRMNANKAIIIEQDKASLVDQKHNENFSLMNKAVQDGDVNYVGSLGGGKSTINKYYNDLYANTNTPVTEVFKDPNVKDYMLTQMAKYHLVPDKWMSQMGEALISNNVGMRQDAAAQLQEIMKNPRLAVASMEIRDKLGEDVIRQTAGIVASPGYAQKLIDGQIKYNRQELEESWMSRAKLTAQTKDGVSQDMVTVQQMWVDRGYDEDLLTPEVIAPMMADYRREVEFNSKHGGFGTDRLAIEGASTDALGAKYGVEARLGETGFWGGRDVTYEVVKGSFYRDSGSADGKPTWQTDAVIKGVLDATGNSYILEDEKYEVIPMQRVDGVYALMRREFVDGRPLLRPIEDPTRAGLPIEVTTQDLERFNTVEADRESAANRGADAVREMMNDTVQGTDVGDRRQSFMDFLIKAGKVSQERGQQYLDTADDIKNMWIDSADYLFSTDAVRIENMDVDNYLATGSTELMNLTPEANDIMWNRQLNRLKEMMTEKNQKNPGTYDKTRFDTMLADYATHMESVQKLVPPAENQ